MNALIGRGMVAVGLVAAVATVAGGCGSSGMTRTTSARHGAAGAGRLATADLLTNLADTKAAGVICLKPSVLRADAGESFDVARPPIANASERRAAERRNRRAIQGALASTVRAELRRAEAVAKSLVKDRLELVTRATERGISQAERNPGLLIAGHVQGFVRAAALADRYGLSTC
jgi:hypothetical protein